MNKVNVIRPGLLTTIQDGGRFGYRHLGVSTSGAMDQEAFRKANLLLGNNENWAVLEVTMMGPTLAFQNNTQIAITGADLSPMINGEPQPNGQSIAIKAGDVLSFGKRINGSRAYIGVSGGWQCDEVMGSRSTHQISDMGGINGRALQKGGELNILDSVLKTTFDIRIQSNINISDAIPLYRGPEFDESLVDYFINTPFKIGNQSNRMAYVLEGANCPISVGLSILSGPVMPGIIQLPPSGRPIILMRDCQTTGGYPRVFCVDEVGIDSLTQYSIGEELHFSFVR